MEEPVPDPVKTSTDWSRLPEGLTEVTKIRAVSIQFKI